MARFIYDMSDTELAGWSLNFAEVQTNSPGSFFLTAAQALAFAEVNALYLAALSVWQTPTTRTPVASEQKKQARLKLIDDARNLIATLNTNPAIAGVTSHRQVESASGKKQKKLSKDGAFGVHGHIIKPSHSSENRRTEFKSCTLTIEHKRT